MKRIAILNIIALVVVFACETAPTTAKSSEGIDLAQLKDWDIVLADDAIPSERYAAEEFQQFFGEASGAKLPIVHKVNRPDRHIFIGVSLAMRSSNVGFSIDDFGEEDLRIVVRDGNIAIAGGRPRGTLYGVYTFLEDYLGVRFLTHDHTHVPPVGDSRVVGAVDRFYHPPFEYRNATYGENLAYPKMATRLRNNASTEDPKFGGHTSVENINHSFNGLVMPNIYGADHPEYYSLIDGKRKVDWQSQLCLTNPEVLKISIATVRQWLAKRPNAKNISVSQNDGGDNYCRCPKCAAIDKREESHMGSILTFVNAVADEIAKTHPNVKIGTLAYNYSQKPPKTIKPRPNVQIQLCSVRVRPTRPISDRSCSQNESFRRVLLGWKRISDDIGIWNYNLNHWLYLLPNPNMRVVEPNIRFFAANNVRRVFMQSPGGVSTEFSDLKNYVASRLLWNPKLNGTKLRNEFLRLHYGPAAGPIRYYLDLLHDKAEAVTKNYMHFAGHPSNFGIDEELVQAGLKSFEAAWELVGDDKVLRARVEKASIAVFCSAIFEPLWWGIKQGGYHLTPDNKPNKPKMPAELERRTRPITRRFFELCDKYGVDKWAEGAPFEKIRDQFRRIYGLKGDEVF